ncbi:MAG: molybdopterin molybdotransferase MoeA [Treponema sp.]|jgi:molybdopterin molybdotransferase|nr:molybdopterin molybdotransferase MoeA [Treponema sp.]
MERMELEEARELALDAVTPIRETRQVPLEEALGLVTAEAIYAPIDSVPFDCSPLDGFALRSEDSRSATAEHPVRLKVVGAVYAGMVFDRAIQKGETVRIMTGAAMPENADCMVPKEAVQDEGTALLLSQPLGHHENYVFRGEDIKKGQLLIAPGQGLEFSHLGILAAMGYGSVSVLRPPNIGLLCTGNELSPPDTPLLPGKIYNSNEVLLGSRLRELRFTPQILSAMGDDGTAVAEKIASSMTALDILLTTGAVSVGDKDIMHEVLALLGAKRLFWRLNCKPGGSVLCAFHKGKLLVCLPGYPFAAVTMLELLVRPVLAKLTGRTGLQLKRRRAILKNPFPKDSIGKRRLLRARLEYSETDPLPSVYLPAGHGSSQIFSLPGCNCLVDIPVGSGALTQGSIVEVIML